MTKGMGFGGLERAMICDDLECIAIEILKCAIVHEPNVCLIGNTTARQVALLAARFVMTCPMCGAEAWCNIDCDLCLVCSRLEREENK